MRRLIILSLGIMMLARINDGALAGESKTRIDFSKTAVVMPFESSLIAASSVIPETTQKYVISLLKEAALFPEVLTSKEAKNRDKATLIEITGRLEDYSSGRTTRGILFSSYRPAYAEFSITIKDSATGTVLWERCINAEEASFASSKSRISEPSKNVARKFVKELQAEKKPEDYPLFHLYGYAGSMLNPSKKAFSQFGGGVEVRITSHLSLSGEISTFLNKNNELVDLKGNDDAIRFSIGPSFHFLRCHDNKLDPFILGGISARGYYGDTGMDWSNGVDRMYYIGLGTNYWFSPRYGLKLALVDHIWPTNGTSLHFMDVRAGINFGVW
jgi:hypothetical protein